jgi:CelD/BcsL family acetyltransferase involved in cellulose biosynthesis
MAVETQQTAGDAPAVEQVLGGAVRAEISILPLAEALYLLRSLQKPLAMGPSSSQQWLCHWSDNVNPNILIALWKNGSRPLVALPLEIVSMRGLKAARYPGGNHANANFPIIWPGYEALSPVGLTQQLTEALASHGAKIDLVRLERQAPDLNGYVNPLVTAQSQPSPNVALHFNLDKSFDELLEARSGKRKRKRNRSQQRKFESAGGYQILNPVEREDVTKTLDTYFTMKVAQLAERGVANVFSDAAEQVFLKAIYSEEHLPAEHQFGLSALEVGGKLRTIYAWSRYEKRLTIHFTAFAKDELAAASPGDFLNFALIEAACADGFAEYDLGVGDEPYKRSWCDIETWHRDTALGLTALGKVECLRLNAMRSAKRFIKNSPALWHAAQRIRKLRSPAKTQPADTEQDS